MLDAQKMRELDIYISKLEFEDSSFDNYSKLASLYTIRNQQCRDIEGDTYSRSYSQDAGPAPMLTAGRYGDSDFLQAIADKNSAAAWAIMDDLMDTLRVVNTKVYNRVMNKIKNL